MTKGQGGVVWLSGVQESLAFLPVEGGKDVERVLRGAVVIANELAFEEVERGFHQEASGCSGAANMSFDRGEIAGDEGD